MRHPAVASLSACLTITAACGVPSVTEGSAVGTTIEAGQAREEPTSHQPILGRWADTVFADAAEFYSWPRLGHLGLGLGFAALSANSQLDRDIYEDVVAGWRRPEYDSFGQAVTGMGEGAFALPTFALAGLLGEHIGLPTVSTWGERTLRAAIVGAPSVLFLQRAIGAGRPEDPANTTASEWQFWEHSNGVSGHAFIGSISWLTAARMSESSTAAALFGVGSLLVPAARLQGDRHYFSQVALGWLIGLMSTGAIDERDANAANWTMSPDLSDGFVGLQFERRF